MISKGKNYEEIKKLAGQKAKRKDEDKALKRIC